jgi:hypothetical protein
MSLKSTAFWEVMLCSSVEVRQNFGGTYYHIFSVKEKARQEIYASWLLGLLFNPEDRGSIFFLMSVNFCSTTQCHIPEDGTVHSHHCECSNPTWSEVA